jgi:hypothetical protein
MKNYFNFFSKIDLKFLATLFLALVVLVVFYGDIVWNLNTIFFTISGDGLQAYFTSIYHVKFDPSFWHFNGLNYPYGEQVFFTGCQPIITNTIKLISPYCSIENYTLGILNAFMLFSIVISAIFLYLIFKYFRINNWWSVIFSVSIAFLAPQIDRFGGHLSLTYVCAIPMVIYYLLKFSDALAWKYSIYIFLTILFFIGTHLYFAVFYFFIISVFFIYLRIYKKHTILSLIKHISIQLFLPLTIFQISNKLIENVSDRPSRPWGYLESNSSIEGLIFMPGRFYSPIYDWIHPIYPPWEGIAYLGVTSSVVLVAMMLIFIWNLLKRNWKFGFTILSDWKLNALFIAGIVSLIFSFGFPFIIIGGEELLQYFGPVKQFRGIGRFTWIIYFVLNIITVFLVIKYNERLVKWKQFTFTGLVAFLFVYDAYCWTRGRCEMYANFLPEMTKSNFYSKQNWFKKIDPKNYQAIIPMPYFHVGSENIWMEPESEIKKFVYPFALSTGLEITGVNMSRTSLTQTYKNLSLILEPNSSYEYLKDCSLKPFLVVVEDSSLNQREKEFVLKSDFITKNNGYSFYKILPEKLISFQKNLFHIKKNEIQNLQLPFSRQGFKTNDSISNFYFENFSQKNSKYILDFTKNFNLQLHSILYEKEIKKNIIDTNYQISFWVKNFTEDLIPRTTVEISFFRKKGRINEVISSTSFQLREGLTILMKKVALIEKDFVIPKDANALKITIWNDNFYKEKELTIDNLLIKPKSTNLVKHISKEIFFYNNRIYNKSK